VPRAGARPKVVLNLKHHHRPLKVRAALCALARGFGGAACARARLRSARWRAARQTGSDLG